MNEQVFISYSRSDIDFARSLAADLRERNYRVWFDDSAIQIGQIWREEIVTGIESSSYFIIILSKSSVYSKNVAKELSLAEGSNKIIFPLLIEEVEITAKMRYQLAGVQYVEFDDVNYRDSLELLVQGMKEASGLAGNFLSELLKERNYTLKACLGCSTYSSTFLIRDQARSRSAVLKLYPCTSELRFFYDAEIASLERVRHPGIPLVLDAFESMGCYCFVQEYVSGNPWPHCALSAKDFLDSVRDVLDILSVVHGAGIIHGEIHPGNLRFSSTESRLFLVDFALIKTKLMAVRLLSKASSDVQEFHKKLALKRAESLIDKKFYEAPEFTRFSTLSPGVDLYSFGVTLLALWTGLSPVDLFDQSRSRWNLEGVPGFLHLLLSRLLEESPVLRLQSAQEALSLLDGSSGGSRDPSQAPGRPVIDDSSIPLRSRQANPVQEGLEDTAWTGVTAPPSLLAISRAALVRRLALRFGPVVNLLLEHFPERLSPVDLDAIRVQWLRSGLDLPALQEAISAAADEPPEPPGRPEAIPASSPESTAGEEGEDTPEDTDQDVGVESAPERTARVEELFLMIRREIGPLAEVFWSTALGEQLLSDPERARSFLVDQGVPPPMIERLLALAGTATRGRTPARGKRPSPAREMPMDRESPVKERLRQVLLETVGPMGALLLDPPEGMGSGPAASMEEVLERLRDFGVGEDVLAVIRRRVLDFPNSP